MADIDAEISYLDYATGDIDSYEHQTSGKRALPSSRPPPISTPQQQLSTKRQEVNFSASPELDSISSM